MMEEKPQKHYLLITCDQNEQSHIYHSTVQSLFALASLDQYMALPQPKDADPCWIESMAATWLLKLKAKQYIKDWSNSARHSCQLVFDSAADQCSKVPKNAHQTELHAGSLGKSPSSQLVTWNLGKRGLQSTVHNNTTTLLSVPK